MYIKVHQQFPTHSLPLRPHDLGEPSVTTCPGYQSGEVKKSKTEQGHLSADVVEEPGRIVISDFGVDWRHLKRSTKNDPILRQ